MTSRNAAGLVAAGLVGLLLPITGVLPGGTSASYAADDAVCDESQIPGSEVLADSKAKTNPPFERMHIPQAQEVSDGTGVKVVVIDSGVQLGLGINPGAEAISLASGPMLSGHGTMVAGLIAGREGVAPNAQVIDIRVFDTEDADVSQGEKAVTSDGIVAGINQAIALYKTNKFQVVNISLSVGDDDPNLRAAVKTLVKLGVVVVASSGNADPDASDTFKGTPDSDADVYPADYPGVLGVSAAPPPGGSPIGSVVPNKDTDVAAPTLEAISVNANGQRCTFDEVATSWAAAEVSGIVALLRSRYPKDTAKQTIARLMATTEGSEGARSPWTGAGIVQAHDALTRSLDPGRSGKVERSVAKDRNDTMPPPPPPTLDLFGSARALLLWFGLAGGALMALAFMLRSLTRR